MSLQYSTADETTWERHIIPAESDTKLSVSLSEVAAWVLMSILTVLCTGLLSVVLLWMSKKRQARDAIKQSTDTHLYQVIRVRGVN